LMKTVAVIANIAQLGIILAILFIRGLDLGALVIFLLFVLMSVPLHQLPGPSLYQPADVEIGVR
jgi:uncharacterized membrane protein YciS (DUF1049 family)